MRSTPFFYQILLICFIGILFVETPGDEEIYKFKEKQLRYKREAGIAALSRSFTIFLADNTEVQAYLMKLSNNHDLALLKIDSKI